VDWTTVTEIFRFRRPLAIPVSASEALEEVGTRG
jgi:hypothetical protein